MQYTNTWNIDKIKVTNKNSYKEATDEELRSSLRAGDSWAGAELMKRQREGTTDFDKMVAQRDERNAEVKAQGMIHQMEDEIKGIEGVLNE